MNLQPLFQPGKRRWLSLLPPAGLVGLLLGWAPLARADFQGSTHLTPYEEDPINYSSSEAAGPVTALQKRLAKGQVKLKYDDEYGYLPAVLAELKVPLSSQLLVFSKTSLHREIISPTNARAIFFNDSVYIGWVRGAPYLEISSADPNLGAVFHLLDQNESPKPQLTRDNSCTECHVGPKTMGAPGHLVRSFATDEKGNPEEVTGNARISHNTPYAERRGGWFVTGDFGRGTHLGNLIGEKDFSRHLKEPSFRSNLAGLGPLVETNKFPQPTSDGIALMVLEHQVHMHNFLTRVNYEARISLLEYGHLKYLNAIVDALLKYFLFTEEPPLADPVQGVSPFRQDFELLGPADSQGRSLRQFDLQTRLFKYPCSFLIYSESFDQLPPKMLELIYRRLWEILSGEDKSEAFEAIPADRKQAILEILIATKPGLPDYWKPKK